jgi:hypothetical protein
MGLQQTIERLVREQGEEILSSPALIGWLDDLGAFSNEDSATKIIMRELVRTGQVRKLIESSKKGQNLQFEIRSIITDTSDACGFRYETVSETLKKIALASGKIRKENEWPKISEQRVNLPNVSQTSKHNASARKKSKKQRISLVKRLDWDGVCAITLILCAILAVVSLFAVFCCWIYESANISVWGWTLLGSVIAGGIVLLLMAIIDD